MKLTKDAVLHWTATGGHFSLTDASHKLHLSGAGRRGQGFAATGDYQQVRVSAAGRWTLVVQLLAAPS